MEMHSGPNKVSSILLKAKFRLKGWIWSYYLVINCLLRDCFVAYIHAVPAQPSRLNVCGVYDAMNGTLLAIESTWNEVVCKIVSTVLTLK